LVKTDTEANAVVTVEKGRHLAFGYASLFQTAAIGRHWNSTKNTLVIVTAPLMIRRPKIALFTVCFCPVRRNRKSMIEVLMSPKMGT
jgi:hypothetical protein